MMLIRRRYFELFTLLNILHCLDLLVMNGDKCVYIISRGRATALSGKLIE